MNRSVLAIFLLVNCIYLVSTASKNQELQSVENDRALNPFGILQTITNLNNSIQNMVKNVVSGIVNSVKKVINSVKTVFQTITGQTTTSAPATTASTAKISASSTTVSSTSASTATASGSSSSTSSTSASIAPKERICMNQLGVELPCSQVTVPYCWTKFPCNADFPPGFSSTPKPVVTYTTTVPDTYTDDSVDIDGQKVEGLCMDVNENWLPCSQVPEPYCYYTHPC